MRRPPTTPEKPSENIEHSMDEDDLLENENQEWIDTHSKVFYNQNKQDNHLFG